MDKYKRHTRIWKFFAPLLRWFVFRRFNIKAEFPIAEGPCIIIPNHASSWDPVFVALTLKDKNAYFVASEHIFRLGFVSKIINYILEPIPRSKARSGAGTSLAILRHLRAGRSVCLFAEGEQTWNGRSIPIFSSTGALVKKSGATLVTYRLSGAYLSLPRWAKNIRKGELKIGPVGIYSPEELSSMTASEVEAVINRDIYSCEWDDQRISPVEFKGKNLAKGLETALFLCPKCRRIGTLKTLKNDIFCDCGLKLTYTATGFFEENEYFPSLLEWDEWQLGKAAASAFKVSGDVVFKDAELHFSQILQGHVNKKIGRGTVTQCKDRLLCPDMSFDLSAVSNMALVQRHILLFECEGRYYQLKSRNNANLRKYLIYWKYRNNI